MWNYNDYRWLLPFGVFSGLVFSLIMYRFFLVDPFVPKPRYWADSVESIPLYVCPGLDVAKVETAMALVPSCEFDLQISTEPCSCTSAGKRQIPLGRVELVAGPDQEDYLTNYLVSGGESWMNEQGVNEPSGQIEGACVVLPDSERPPPVDLPSFPDGQADEFGPDEPGLNTLELTLVYAHELAHACGYAHAVGDPFSTNVHNHLMSPEYDLLGEDTRGMDLSANEAWY